MKQIILTALVLMLFGCKGEKEVYRRELKPYVISDIEHVDFNAYRIYFQTPTTTENAVVDNGYFNYKIGDTIHVLIKYWEKPKKK